MRRAPREKVTSGTQQNNLAEGANKNMAEGMS